MLGNQAFYRFRSNILYNQNVKKNERACNIYYARMYKHNISVVVIGGEYEIIVKYFHRLKYLTTFLFLQYKMNTDSI